MSHSLRLCLKRRCWGIATLLFRLTLTLVRPYKAGGSGRSEWIGEVCPVQLASTMLWSQSNAEAIRVLWLRSLSPGNVKKPELETKALV